MNIVLDTSVLVLAIWSPGRNASDILNAVFSRRFTACYDHRILEEYDRILHYKKFSLSEWEINSILEPIIKNGISVIADPLPNIPFTDDTDRKFYEVAKSCHALLVTGNGKHHPEEKDILTLSEFCARYL